MMLNIQVIRSGLLLFNLRCRNLDFSLPDFVGNNLTSAFFTVLNTISETCIGASIKYIKLQNFSFHFYNDVSVPNLLFVITTQIDSDPEEIRLQLKKIASIFNENFSNNLCQFNGNLCTFQNFQELLAEI